MSKVKRDLLRIKETNPKDYQALLLAAHEYSNTNNDWFKKQMLAVVTDLLDKHGVKYVDDVTGGLNAI